MTELFYIIFILVAVIIYLLYELKKERGRPTINIMKNGTSDFESKIVELRKNITSLSDQFYHREKEIKKIEEGI